ncbi:MAG: (d)CMP kinase [Nitrosospira sp.]|nr:(d)CMP kinase [Nitrosospira sp.]MDW7643248.1 (d)CMP kinase [Nitrosomonadaceae bacterium]MBI0407212.1 (d)CMP kinase [Nitrosospira sp.]MBI0415145.1 (d)CMP kinase [Nitrosospira sp.]MBI0415670.1 (d)CMP kinase [Nitrosospira sp.]
MSTEDVPVIAIDGPSASGKGTVAQRVAEKLDFHYLDSGALYRLVALIAIRSRVNLANEMRLANIARDLNIKFLGQEIRLENENVTDLIRAEICGTTASKIAAYPQVRNALLDRQRAFCLYPGLVADGRDMCSVVFPNATFKIFLTASIESRVQRRYKQLIEKGINVRISDILRNILDRDACDMDRSVSPLLRDAGSGLLDTTLLTVTEVIDEVIKRYTEISTKNI